MVLRFADPNGAARSPSFHAVIVDGNLGQRQKTACGASQLNRKGLALASARPPGQLGQP